MEAARKFQRISMIMTFLYFTLTLIVIPILSYLYNDYFLLFGILFSILGGNFTHPQLKKLFVLATIGIIIYWISSGINFTEKLTFFWFCLLFGYLCKTFINGYEELGYKIIEQDTSEIFSRMKSGIEFNEKLKNKK